MAAIDYLHCAECGKRLAYDGEWEFRQSLISTQKNFEVTCYQCVKRLKKRIIELQKHDKRRH